MAEIREINHIDEILPEVSPASVVLLDIDETLIETPLMLGGKSWRKYARSILKKTKTEKEVAEIHDKITYFIAKRIPYVAVEKGAPLCINEFRKREASVFGFTLRGKKHWYEMPVTDGEELTRLHLRQAGFDLNLLNTPISQALFLHPSFSQGVFFAYPIEDKGNLVLELFAETQFRPSKIIFVDDKIESVCSVHNAFEQLGIPALCFHYRHIDLYRSFDPMIANIQLEKLFFENKILSNDEAALLKESYADKDPDIFFLELVSHLYFKYSEGKI